MRLKPTQAQIKMALAYQAPSGHPLREYAAPKKRISRKNKQPEQLLQEMICQYLDTQPKIHYWANNPQVMTGKMKPQKMNYLAKQKRRGFKKGVPDLCLHFLNKHNESTFCGVELKSLKGIVSAEQTAWMIKCEERGGYAAIVKSLDDLQELLRLVEY